MNKKIKKIIARIIGKKNACYIRQLKIFYNKLYKMGNGRISSLTKSIISTRVYYDKEKGKEFYKLIKHLKIKSSNNKYFYFIDFYKIMCWSNLNISNLCIDYSIILNNSLDDLKNKLSKENENFYKNELYVIKGMELYVDKILDFLKVSDDKDLINIFTNIKTGKAESFFDALQRILFINMLLWQTNHRLNGLGRLDKVLISYYLNDIRLNKISKEEAKTILKDFLITLHSNYEMKSAALLGDTGQIIELGGKEPNGTYFCNELTFLFIELMEELKLPDPKILLRVSDNTPRQLIEKSLRCIQTGIGCPIFANDDVIIDKLIKFGYNPDDAFNYGTSACWEPYIIGKSSAQNNVMSINYMVPWNDIFEQDQLSSIKSNKDLFSSYKMHLEKYISQLHKQLKSIVYEPDPLLSLFIDDCITRGKDISEGGAIYNDMGLTTVGLANVVNSFINIDEYVFKNNLFTLESFNQIRKDNYINNIKLLNNLKKSSPRYGEDNKSVLDLSNEIIKYTSVLLNKERNYLGGRYKFGLSSPSYISLSENFPASFDGRQNGDPFIVHISTDKSNAYTDLVNFASKLDYNDNRFNGNVVDYFVTPNFIKDNFDKFVDFLIASIKVAFFEMQMNVVSSKQLIEARKNPDLFPNLVVRVWGFSAYFKDLPDEYKDFLIERAIKNESNHY